MAKLKINNITKEFVKGKPVVDKFSLESVDGELIVIVGPSGCGKSTTLRLIAGIENVTDGQIFLGDKEITQLGPQERDVAMVFQNYALYENMTVFRNIAFPLEVRKETKNEIKQKVSHIANILKIEHLLERRPKNLSGGEKQRVAMARALVRRPKLFLMDEPLSNLDKRLKIELREEIWKIQKELRTTTIYVTHDQDEAMCIADRIVVMNQGKIEQVDTPEDIYNKPKTPFVASFFGQTPMNMWIEDECIVGIRPESILISKELQGECVNGIVEGQYYSGTHWVISTKVFDRLLTVYSDKPFKKGSQICLNMKKDDFHSWKK